MRDALRASGRRILYSINPNSSGDPDAGTRYDWSAIADLSRNFIDLVPSWGDDALWAQGLTGRRPAVHRGGAAGARAAAPAGGTIPTCWWSGIPWPQFVIGHPDMVLSPAHPDLTDDEQRAHFSLWAMLAAPLLAGNDVRP